LGGGAAVNGDGDIPWELEKEMDDTIGIQE
jgi:hypothetical protein